MTSHPVQPAVMPARKNKKDRFLHLAKNRLRTEDLTQGFESPSTLPLLNEPLGIRTPDNLIKSQVLYHLS